MFPLGHCIFYSPHQEIGLKNLDKLSCRPVKNLHFLPTGRLKNIQHNKIFYVLKVNAVNI